MYIYQEKSIFNHTPDRGNLPHLGAICRMLSEMAMTSLIGRRLNKYLRTCKGILLMLLLLSYLPSSNKAGSLLNSPKD